jgi:hypothetical protein
MDSPDQSKPVARSRDFKYYSNWQNEVFTCPKCGWTGTVTTMDLGDPFPQSAPIECPKCFKILGAVLFPDVRDTEEAAAKGNEEAIRSLASFRETEKRQKALMEKFERHHLSSIEQLPDLPGESLEFTWDIGGADDETYQIIRAGGAGTEIWREVAFFDSIARFKEVRSILKEKYGTRFKSLKPSDASWEWLCGDNYLTMKQFTEEMRNEEANEPRQHWGPERAALHQAIVESYLDGHQPAINPRLIAVTSGPASGKAGALNDAKKQFADYLYLNTDNIRPMLPEFELVMGTNRVGLLHAEASYIRDLVLEAAIRLNINIILDALGGQGVVRILDYAEKKGYRVAVYYVHKPVEEALPVARERRYVTTNVTDLCEVPDDTTRWLHDKAREGLTDEARPNREFKVYDKSGTPSGSQAGILVYDRDCEGRTRVYDEGRLKQICNADPIRVRQDVFTLSDSVADGAASPPEAHGSPAEGAPDDEYTPGEFSGLGEPEPDFEEAGRAVDAVFAQNPKWEALLERTERLKSEKAGHDLP